MMKLMLKTYSKSRKLLSKKIIELNPHQYPKGVVLLSYITNPFQIKHNNQVFYRHTNQWECFQIAKTWLDHGYNVDVIDWNNSLFLPKKKYSVFIDIHSNMERLGHLMSNDCIKILHITGAHWRFQNDAEMKRISNLKFRKGVDIQPRRTVVPSYGIECADCATILGNKFTQETFAYANKPLYQIPLSTTITFPYYQKNFDVIRNNFLWLGSLGMVHKGLDLVLDVFRDLPDYNLTICGPVNKEKDFEQLYYQELYKTPNIKTMGFCDINRNQFSTIIKNTCALIYPSCSEGQSGSVITCLHAGLIPVISYESGVDVDDFGLLLHRSDLEEIKTSVIKISQKPKEELEQMSKKAVRYARTHHTREKFSESYSEFVTKIIDLITP